MEIFWKDGCRRCTSCFYPGAGLESSGCPECGGEIEVLKQSMWHPKPIRSLAGVALPALLAMFPTIPIVACGYVLWWIEISVLGRHPKVYIDPVTGPKILFQTTMFLSRNLIVSCVFLVVVTASINIFWRFQKHPWRDRWISGFVVCTFVLLIYSSVVAYLFCIDPGSVFEWIFD